MLGRTRLVATGRAVVARARTRAKLALDWLAVRWLKSGMHSVDEDGSEDGKWPAVKKGCWRIVWSVGRSSAGAHERGFAQRQRRLAANGAGSSDTHWG